MMETSRIDDRMQAFRKYVKSCVGRAMFNCFLHRLFLSDSWIVVAFHRVNNEEQDGDGLTCSVEMFEWYCRFFSRFFRVLPLEAIIEKMESKRPARGELAITFDDGYRDNYQYAAPILKKNNLPATFFVATQFIGTDYVPWWDRDIGIRMPWMTWDQVRQLHKEGFEIGSHTRSHLDLAKINEEEAKREIVGSLGDLEAQLSAPIVSFAFPYGRETQMTDERRQIVKDAGLRCCCSCDGGTNARDSDPFYLRRVPISPWYVSPYQFGLELALEQLRT